MVLNHDDIVNAYAAEGNRNGSVKTVERLPSTESQIKGLRSLNKFAQ